METAIKLRFAEVAMSYYVLAAAGATTTRPTTKLNAREK